MRDTGYISRMLIEESNRHSGLTAELLEGAASELDLLVDEKADLQQRLDAAEEALEKIVKRQRYLQINGCDDVLTGVTAMDALADDAKEGM